MVHFAVVTPTGLVYLALPVSVDVDFYFCYFFVLNYFFAIWVALIYPSPLPKFVVYANPCYHHSPAFSIILKTNHIDLKLEWSQTRSAHQENYVLTQHLPSIHLRCQ